MTQLFNKKQTFWFYSSIVLIIILLINFFTYNYLKKSELNKELKKVQNIQKNLSKDIEQYFENNLTNITNIVSNQIFVNDLSKDIEVLSKSELSKYPDLLFISPDGLIKYSQKKEIPLNSNIYKDYKNSLLTSLNDQLKNLAQPGISDFDYLGNIKDPIMFIGVPIYYENKFFGNILVSVNTNEVSDLIKSYFDKLDKSGDLLVAKKTGKNALVIFPSKFNPASAFTESFNINEKNAINLALSGSKATDILKVYDSEIINSRNILKIVPWAISVEENKTNLDKKFNIFKYIILLVYIITLIFIFVFIFVSFNLILSLIFKYKSNIILISIILLFIYLLTLFSSNLIKYNENKIKLTSQSFIQTKLQIEHISSLLQQNLNDIKILNSTLASDISSEKLNESNLDNFLQNTFDKYPYVSGVYIAYAPNEYKPDVKLFGQYFINKDGTLNKGQLDKIYDYTETDWYNKTIKAFNENTSTDLWFGPLIEKGITNEINIMHAVPILTKDKQKIKGIVSILYSYSSIAEIIALLGQNKLQNSIIFANDGKLIFYSNKDSILEDANFKNLIFDINPQLEPIQEKGANGFSGYLKFKNNLSNEKMWAFYESIPISNWTLVIFYPNSDFSVFNKSQYNYYISVIIILTLLLILTLIFVTKIYFDLQYLLYFSLLYSLIVLVSTTLILFVYYNYPTSEFNKNIVTNKLELDRLIEKEMQRFPENFMTTKGGINLQSLEDKTFVAYLWQKLNKETQKDVIPGVEIINLFPYDGLYFYLGEAIKTSTINNIETTRWLCQSNAYQNSSLDKYPFDIKNFKFHLSPVDQNKKILLIPDLKDYPGINPESKPGISPDAKIENFEILKSYFSYENEFDNQQTLIKKPKNLTLNILLQREFLPIFISYFIPLFIILITLFCTFIIKYYKESDEFALIAGYSGFLFTLILLHQGYRSAINPSSISFLEYVMFLVYIYIALAFIDIFTRKSKIIDKIILYNFWPLFLTMLFAVTIKTFYI